MTKLATKPSTQVTGVDGIGLPFFSKSGRFFKLKAPLASYTIDFRLKSAQIERDWGISETSPPMPALIGGIAFLQAAETYLIKIPGHNDAKSLGAPYDWTRITIACDSDTSGTDIYVNGDS